MATKNTHTHTHKNIPPKKIHKNEEWDIYIYIKKEENWYNMCVNQSIKASKRKKMTETQRGKKRKEM